MTTPPPVAPGRRRIAPAYRRGSGTGVLERPASGGPASPQEPVTVRRPSPPRGPRDPASQLKAPPARTARRRTPRDHRAVHGLAVAGGHLLRGWLGSSLRRARSGRRIWCVLLAWIVITGALGYRLVVLQVVDAGAYAEQATAQTHREVDLPASRGAIYDRGGAPLALSVTGATVEADPQLVRSQTRDLERTSSELAQALERDPAAVRADLERDSRFVYLGRQVPAEVGDAVAALAIPGIAVKDEPVRVYPAGDLAAPVIGFAGIDHTGLSGIESVDDELLAGVPGTARVERAPHGLEIAAAPREVMQPVPGTDLVLTLDQEIQEVAETALRRVVAEQNAAGASAVVLDPHTGEIYALAAVREETPARATRAQPVTDIYEPGSVAKIVTISAALEEGLVSPATTFDVPQEYEVGDKVFTDDHADDDGVKTVREIIAASSNIGTISVAERLGPQRLHDWGRRFGFGSRTGLGFPGESAGILADATDWSATSLPTIAIGHGVSTTLLQMADVLGVVANGGEWVRPTLVRGHRGTGGGLESAPEPQRRRVISAGTAGAMSDMLVDVVESEQGTGTLAAIDGYHVAGKTGTSQKSSDDSRGYRDGAYVASFAGFAPAADPRLVVAVMVDEPRDGQFYGGQLASPLFAEITGFALAHLRVPPETAAQTVAGGR